MKTKCLLPGFFGILTKGHEWLIRLLSKGFDEVIISLRDCSEKREHYYLNLEQRLELLEQATSYLDNVAVVKQGNISDEDFAEQQGVIAIAYGITNDSDREKVSIIKKNIEQKALEITAIGRCSPSSYKKMSAIEVEQHLYKDWWWETLAEQAYVSDATLDFLVDQRLLGILGKAVGPDPLDDTKTLFLLLEQQNPMLAEHDYKYYLLFGLQTLLEQAAIEGLKKPLKKVIFAFYYKDSCLEGCGETAAMIGHLQAQHAGWSSQDANDIYQLIKSANLELMPLVNKDDLYALTEHEIKLIRDASYAIYGTDPEHYNHFVWACCEFRTRKSRITAFIKKREAYVKRVLARDRFFWTSGYFKFEKQAQINLQEEAKTLQEELSQSIA